MRDQNITRIRDKIKIRLGILTSAFEGLESELKELRDRRLAGENFSESDNREQSIVAEEDRVSQ